MGVGGPGQGTGAGILNLFVKFPFGNLINPTALVSNNVFKIHKMKYVGLQRKTIILQYSYKTILMCYIVIYVLLDKCFK